MPQWAEQGEAQQGRKMGRYIGACEQHPQGPLPCRFSLQQTLTELLLSEMLYFFTWNFSKETNNHLEERGELFRSTPCLGNGDLKQSKRRSLSNFSLQWSPQSEDCTGVTKGIACTQLDCPSEVQRSWPSPSISARSVDTLENLPRQISHVQDNWVRLNPSCSMFHTYLYTYAYL